MSPGDSYSKIKRAFTTALRDGLEKYGFRQYNATVYFFRDRGSVRDVIFFQKMRGSSFCIAYGVSKTPDSQEWSPGIKIHQWLERQRFYNCHYVEHAISSAREALNAIEHEALPWMENFKTL